MPFEKPSREKEPPKTLVKVVTSNEFERFVLNNRKQLLAIFCRKGKYNGWVITVSSFCQDIDWIFKDAYQQCGYSR